MERSRRRERAVASPAAWDYLLAMADREQPSQKALREQRLQAALRENLKRRKAQARGRAERNAEHDSAGIDVEKQS
jgi:hypothetical protein